MSNRARKGYIPFVLVVGLEADEFPTAGLSPCYTHTSTQGLTASWNLCCCESCRIVLVSDLFVLFVSLKSSSSERCSRCLFVDSRFSVSSCSPVCCCLDWCCLLPSLFTVILHLEGFWVFYSLSRLFPFRVFSGLICRVFVPSLPSCAPPVSPHYPHLFHIHVLVQLCPLCWIIACFTSCLFRSL